MQSYLQKYHINKRLICTFNTFLCNLYFLLSIDYIHFELMQKLNKLYLKQVLSLVNI